MRIAAGVISAGQIKVGCIDDGAVEDPHLVGSGYIFRTRASRWGVIVLFLRILLTDLETAWAVVGTPLTRFVRSLTGFDRGAK